MGQWYEGQYKVLDKVGKLSEQPRLATGDILRHDSGALILRCPACNAMQFTRAEIYNAETRPTLDRAIQCGSGHCQKCAVWFTIEKGKAVLATPTEKKKPPELDSKLKRAGVKYPEPLVVEDE